MAVVEVDNWDALITAITTGTEDTTIKLINDIDLNDEHPEGITSRIVANAHKYTIDGQGQFAIRNLLLIDGTTSGKICGLNDSNFLTFVNIKLENWIAENNTNSSANNSYLFNYVAIYNSDISLKLIGNENLTANTSTNLFRISQCALRIEGYIGKFGCYPLIFFELAVDSCNFTLLGAFFQIKFRPKRCFIGGDFETKARAGTDINFDYAYLTVITATINTTGISNSNGSQCPIDMSVITATDIVSNNFIKCNTGDPDSPDIKSPSDLAAAGFVIVPKVVGGD